MSRFPFVRVCLTVALFAGFLAPAFGSARDDVRIRSDRDKERTTVYTLANDGARTVKAKVELTIDWSGISSDRKPGVRDHWVNAGETVELGKTRFDSSCRRDYRILEATYP